MSHALRRYSSMVPDVDAFVEAASRPLPRVVWANPLRAPVEVVSQRIAELCPDATPVPWRPYTWRVPHDVRPGTWPEFALGLVHTQEEITLWPSLVLAPRPGERVLDLCASPGNKSAHLALQMADTGQLTANEPVLSRLAPLAELVHRLGLTNVVTTSADGRALELEPGSFDRVLVDAPCTGEGTSRKSKGHLRFNPSHARIRMHRIQRGLLARALQLVKPGGAVVYCTCTYAPEENEAVLHSVPEDIATIEPLPELPGLVTRPGVARWRGLEFRRDVVNAGRVWPHENDTGGFFVALLRRRDAASDASSQPSPLSLAASEATASPFELWPERQRLLEWLEWKLGIAPEKMDGHSFWHRPGSPSIWIAARDCAPLAPATLESMGLLFMRHPPPRGYPTTAFLQRFGHLCTKRVVEVARQHALPLMLGESVDAPEELSSLAVVASEGLVLGRGFAREGKLVMEFPHSRREWLLAGLKRAAPELS